MDFKEIPIVCFVVFIVVGCRPHDTTTESAEIRTGPSRLFPQGQKITNNNFCGTAYLNTLVEADSVNPTTIGIVTFDPGARTKWHQHPGGQILLVTDGVGYYQEKDQAKQIIRRGDVIKCAANVAHWHGASPDSAFVQLAITNRHLGETVWLNDVTEEEYSNQETHFKK